MADNPQADQPETPQKSLPKEEKAVSERFASYWKLRNKIQAEYTHQFRAHLSEQYSLARSTRDPSKLTHPNLSLKQKELETFPDHQLELSDDIDQLQEIADHANRITSESAFIIAQRAIKHLPKEKGKLNRKTIAESLLTAQNELAENDVMFAAVSHQTIFAATFFPEKKRKQLAAAVADRIDLSEPGKSLITSAIEQSAGYAQSLDPQQSPSQSSVTADLKQQLQNYGLSTNQSEKISNQTIDALESQTLSLGAELPESRIQKVLQINLFKFADKAVLDKNPDLAENIVQSSKTTLGKRLNSIGNNKQSILKSAEFAKRFFKIGSQVDRRFKKIHKAFRVASAVRHPLKFSVKNIAKKIGSKAISLTARAVSKVLIKLGLGGLVRAVEEIVLAGSGIGIPLLILQESVLFSISQLKKAVKSVKESWRKASESTSMAEGMFRTAGASVDTLGATAGGAVGGTAGTIGGAVLGGLVGSAFFGFGAIPGVIIGGLAGGALGTGVGANFGSKIRKHILRWLAMRIGISLLMSKLIASAAKLFAIVGSGVLGFIVAGPVGALLAAAATYVGIKLLPKAVTSVKQLGYIIRHYTVVEGPIAQFFKSVGNFFSRIPSALAQGFNALTGALGGTTAEAAAVAEATAGEILTASAPAGLTATPLITLGVLGVTAFFAYNALISIFYVPPTEVDPYYEDPSRFIKITKIACVRGVCQANQMHLANPFADGAGPYDITYEIQVEAVERRLTNVTITDKYSSFGRYQDPNKAPEDPPAPPPLEWNGGITLDPGDVWTPPSVVSVNIPAAQIWDDAILTNSVVVEATVEDFGQAENAKAMTIIFGNPPFCPPNGDPYDKAFGITQLYEPGVAPGTHKGIDLSAGFGSTIYSTFNCEAIVRHSGWDTWGGDLGNFVTLQSGPWFAFYAHMSTHPDVTEGDPIFGRVPLGQEGSTGKSSGSHLHYEIREGLDTVEPHLNWQPHLARDPCDFGITGC